MKQAAIGPWLACSGADVVKIVDVKCPGSGEADKNDFENFQRLGDRDEVKFVIKDRADYDFARDLLRSRDLSRAAAIPVYVPSTQRARSKRISEWMLADRVPARLQIQLHKIIWTPTTRGV